MSYLYCQNTDCGEYLGSLGARCCFLCGWRAGDAVDEADQEYNNQEQ